LVAADFFCPPFPICFGNRTVFWATMPKAAIDEYGELVTQEGNINIGANHPGVVVNPVSEAGRKKNFTNS
jgi:hypothetical protein